MKNIFLLLALISGIATKALSAESPAKPSDQENRFLFVIDTSLSMNRSAKAVQEFVRELIESGVQGQMHPGDTFGLWTFNEKLNAEFPMQRWTPGDEKKISELVSDFLKNRRYEKKSQLHSVLPALYPVIKSSKAITVVLISNGIEPVQGTTFDQEINAIYPSYVRELHDAKLAFATVLVGRNGKPVAYSVNSSLTPIEIPQPPIELEKITVVPKTNLVQAVTNQIPVRSTNRIAAPKPQPKTVAPSTATSETNPPTTLSALVTAPKLEIKTNEVAIISTNISVPITAPKLGISPPTLANESSVAVPEKVSPAKIVTENSASPSNQVATSSPSEKTKPHQESVRERATEEKARVNSTLPGFQPKNPNSNSEIAYGDPSAFKPEMQRVGVPSSTNSPKPTHRVRPDTLRKHNTAPLDPAPPEKPISPAPVVVATQPIFASQKLLIAGAALLAVAGILVFCLLRNSRKSQPSLISRSIDRPK